MKLFGRTPDGFRDFLLGIVLFSFLLSSCGGGGDAGGDLPPPESEPAVVGFAYAVNVRGNSISQYTVGADGKLAPMSPPTIVAGDGPYAVALDPWGKFAYVANRSNVSQFLIGEDGKLTPMSPPTMAAGVAPNHLTVDPGGRFAYVVNSGEATVSQYMIGADGKLAPMFPATVATGYGPSFIAIDPGGRFAYVTNWGGNGYGNTVSQYTIETDGTLTPMSPSAVPAGQGPNSITVDPSGRFAYVVNAHAPAGVAPPTTHTLTNNISQYTIGVDGKLTPMSPATVWTGLSPYSITVDPGGRFVYVANYWDDNVSQYTIATDGKLVPMNPAKVAAGNGPFCVVVDPGGEFAYVANSGDDTISQYRIGPDGTLVPMSPAMVAAGGGPVYLATTIHPWRNVRILGGT